ncbi:MAG: hypothetical protein LBQ78_00775 [Tannerellaceae bacterium]|jgi:hypothetical protein|nr:hypothetical protein [Tannerellaceae bacterium]
MGRLGDWLEKWEAEVAEMLRKIVFSKETNTAIVEADEVCFFGSVQGLPPSLHYMSMVGTPVVAPEIYVVGIKDGQLIPPNIWTGTLLRERLEWASIALTKGMRTLMDICDEEYFTRPTAVKTAVVIATDEAFTKYDFDPLPSPPFPGMSAADWAFDQWTFRIRTTGSAYRELKESKK